jgi:hypothetical protein
LASAFGTAAGQTGFNFVAKEIQNVVDNFRGVARALVPGNGDLVHDGRVHSHPAGRGRCHVLDSNHSGPKSYFLMKGKKQ